MKPWYKYTFGLIILSLVLGGSLLWIFRTEIFNILDQIHHHAEILEKINPIFLILIIAILPAIGFPAVPFYVVGSVVYGLTWGLIFSAIGLGINLSLSYWIAKSFLRKWIFKLIQSRGYQIHNIPSHEVKATIIAIRLVPGLPLPLQNYILSIAGVPFKQYLIFSWIFEMLWVLFFVLTANTVVHRTIESLILALFGLFALALFAKIFRDIARNKKL